MSLTPLVDVVFLLLVFFLVATTFYQQERDVRVTLPSMDVSRPLSEPPPTVTVNVLDTGDLVVNGRVVNWIQVSELVREARSLDPDSNVVIRADENALYKHVAPALAACQAGGAPRPILMFKLGRIPIEPK
jgi:biopolymer transport protein ExbD